MGAAGKLQAAAKFLGIGAAGNDAGAPELPRNLMIAVSLVQGAALLALWRAATEGHWPLATPAINFPLWTLAIVWPALLLLTLESANVARAFKLATGAAAIAALLGVYTGWQASPHGEFPIPSLLAVYVLTLLVACFIALMHLQQAAAGARATSPLLFAGSWRNFLVAGLSGALTAGVAAILMLWGLLFQAIGIDFFMDLFSEDWFLFPVLAVAFGLGTFIFRRLTRVIDAIVNLLEGLMRLLLPLLAAVMAIFLATLPFTGLAPLWDTGNGTALLMTLNAAALFALNAVYQTGERKPYPQLVHRALAACLALLPIISALALYGLSLRVGQHGWTVARCWGVAVAVLLAAFSVGYAWNIVRRRDVWTAGFPSVNIWMGWAVLALMLVVHTPVLDFRTIALASQFSRLEAGEIEFMDFDFAYVEEHLARPGWLKRSALIEEHETTNPTFAERVRHPIPSWSDNRIWTRMAQRPAPFDVPPELRAAIMETHPLNTDSALVRIDLNADGQPEYALLFAVRGDRYIWGELFYVEGCGAQAPQSAPPNARDAAGAPGPGAARDQCAQPRTEDWRTLPLRAGPLPEGTDAIALLREGAVGTAPPRFADLKLGELVITSAL